MHGGEWFSGNEWNMRLLEIGSSPPSIGWITNEIPCILKSSLCPLRPMLWLYNYIWMLWLGIWLYWLWIWIIWVLWIRTLVWRRVNMCMLIILDRWKSEGVCMQLLRYMQDTFLELDTMLNDESVRGNINKLISLHTVRASKKNALSALWIKCFPLFRGNSGPCMRTKNEKVGHF